MCRTIARAGKLEAGFDRQMRPTFAPRSQHRLVADKRDVFLNRIFLGSKHLALPKPVLRENNFFYYLLSSPLLRALASQTQSRDENINKNAERREASYAPALEANRFESRELLAPEYFMNVNYAQSERQKGSSRRKEIDCPRSIPEIAFDVARVRLIMLLTSALFMVRSSGSQSSSIKRTGKTLQNIMRVSCSPTQSNGSLMSRRRFSPLICVEVAISS